MPAVEEANSISEELDKELDLQLKGNIAKRQQRGGESSERKLKRIPNF